MSTAIKHKKHSSFFSSGSLWGTIGGVLLGVGVAVGIQAGLLMFPLIVLGSGAMGAAFGNLVDSILSGEEKYSTQSPSRNFTAGDLEQSSELIDHLRLRENEYKMQLEKETAEMKRVKPVSRLTPSMQSVGMPVSENFRSMVQKQSVDGIRR